MSEHDATIDKIIPPFCECSLSAAGTGGTCINADLGAKIADILEMREYDVDEAKTKTACDTEKCVVQKVARQIPGDEARLALIYDFKVSGPTDTTLLSNVNIDTILQQWRKRWPAFYPYNFNMRNYAKYSFRDGRVVAAPDTLATVGLDDWHPEHDCAACVVNSDTYQGFGKHWMALFVDLRLDPPSVEFFNSSGNPPAPEWIRFMTKMKTAIEMLGHSDVRLVKNGLRHQNSRSECGVYSLFYIYSRLCGIPPAYFDQKVVPDAIMFEFRQHLFAGGEEFDWTRYQARHRIEWE